MSTYRRVKQSRWNRSFLGPLFEDNPTRTGTFDETEMKMVVDHVVANIMNPEKVKLRAFQKEHNISDETLAQVKRNLLLVNPDTMRSKPAFGYRPLVRDDPDYQPFDFHNKKPTVHAHAETKGIERKPSAKDLEREGEREVEKIIETARKEGHVTEDEILDILSDRIRAEDTAGHVVNAIGKHIREINEQQRKIDTMGIPAPETYREMILRAKEMIDCLGDELVMEALEERKREQRKSRVPRKEAVQG